MWQRQFFGFLRLFSVAASVGRRFTSWWHVTSSPGPSTLGCERLLRRRMKLSNGSPTGSWPHVPKASLHKRARAPRQQHGRPNVLSIPETPGAAGQALHNRSLVERATQSLRPHPTYERLCTPTLAARVRRVQLQPGPIREPLLTTPCIASIDFRSLSLNSPSRYRLAASRCGCRLKQVLNPAR